MNIFKPFTLKWWQAALFKVSLLSLGLVAGATWPGVFDAFRPELLAIFLVLAGYLTWIWWRQ